MRTKEELEEAMRWRTLEKQRAVAQMKLDMIRDEIAGILGSTMTGAAIRRRLQRVFDDTTPDPLADAVLEKMKRG